MIALVAAIAALTAKSLKAEPYATMIAAMAGLALLIHFYSSNGSVLDFEEHRLTRHNNRRRCRYRTERASRPFQVYERLLMSLTRTPVNVPVMKATVQIRVQTSYPPIEHVYALRRSLRRTATPPFRDAISHRLRVALEFNRARSGTSVPSVPHRDRKPT